MFNEVPRTAPKEADRAARASAVSGRTVAVNFGLFHYFAAAALALGCYTKDAPEPTGTGGTEVMQAEPPNLPGEGREPTPAFDMTTRERPEARTDQLPERLDSIRGQLDPTDDDDATDAGTADADAAPDSDEP